MTKNYKKNKKTASQIAISVLSAEERKCGVGRPAAPAPSHLASASTGARSSPHPHPGAARRITSSRTQASAAPPLLCAAPSAPIRSIAEQFLQFLQSHVPRATPLIDILRTPHAHAQPHFKGFGGAWIVYDRTVGVADPFPRALVVERQFLTIFVHAADAHLVRLRGS